MCNSMNIHKIQTRLIFESPDYLIAESNFREVAVIDLKSLTVVVTTEVFV